jgi:hypothetical protein
MWHEGLTSGRHRSSGGGWISVDAELMNVNAVPPPLIQPSAPCQVLKCPAATNGGQLSDQDIVGHEALLVVDAPPDVSIDIARRRGVDGDGCPVLDAGHNL